MNLGSALVVAGGIVLAAFVYRAAPLYAERYQFFVSPMYGLAWRFSPVTGEIALCVAGSNPGCTAQLIR